LDAIAGGCFLPLNVYTGWMQKSIPLESLPLPTLVQKILQTSSYCSVAKKTTSHRQRVQHLGFAFGVLVCRLFWVGCGGKIKYKHPNFRYPIKFRVRNP
jgi:hypothetical protein